MRVCTERSSSNLAIGRGRSATNCSGDDSASQSAQTRAARTGAVSSFSRSRQWPWPLGGSRALAPARQLPQHRFPAPTRLGSRARTPRGGHRGDSCRYGANGWILGGNRAQDALNACGIELAAEQSDGARRDTRRLIGLRSKRGWNPRVAQTRPRHRSIERSSP